MSRLLDWAGRRWILIEGVGEIAMGFHLVGRQDEPPSHTWRVDLTRSPGDGQELVMEVTAEYISAFPGLEGVADYLQLCHDLLLRQVVGWFSSPGSADPP